MARRIPDQMRDEYMEAAVTLRQEGMSCSEIADELELSRTTVKALLEEAADCMAERMAMLIA